MKDKPKRPGRPSTVKNYSPGPESAGAYWVARDADEAGAEWRAVVRLVPITGDLCAMILLEDAAARDYKLVTLWQAEGWNRWRERLLVSQPAARWREFFDAAWARIIKRGGFKRRDAAAEQVAAEIIRHGDGEEFLRAVRRGRGTQRQNLRWRLLREVELKMGDAVPRRREDSNTPDALAQRAPSELTLESEP